MNKSNRNSLLHLAHTCTTLVKTSYFCMHARALSVFLSLSTTAVKALCVLLASSFVLLAPMGGREREKNARDGLRRMGAAVEGSGKLVSKAALGE